LIENEIFYTKTMAKVYYDQGKFDESAKIYKYLLKREPDRHDFIEALSEVEKKRFINNLEGLAELFNRWVDLLLIYNGMQKLKQLKRHLDDGS